MAVPARVQRHETSRSRPVFGVVEGGKGRSRKADKSRLAFACRKKRCRSEAACRQTFMIACTVLALAVFVGMGRVAVTVKATEAAVAASSLAADIEAERVRLDQLEAHKSALVSSPRIQSLAQTSMKMGAAGEVTYMELPGTAPVVSAVDSTVAGPMADASLVGRSGKVAEILSGIMRMTAGEAQVLLVGDAGLISSR